jgi:hypothetical protein
VVSLRDAVSGEEFLDRDLGETVPGFDLLHQNGKLSPLGVHPLASKVHYYLLTDQIAEIVLNDWECDLSIRLSVDASTGDILFEPSAWTMQGGVAGIAFNLSGIRKDLDVIGPFQQGARLPLTHPQMQGKVAQWAFDWEAAFLVFANKQSVHHQCLRTSRIQSLRG